MDYADKRWLRKYRRPLWQLLADRCCRRMSTAPRRHDPLPRGIRIRVEAEGLAYIQPRPN